MCSAQLFPSRLQDSPRGELLDGWKKRADEGLNSMCPFIYAATAFLLCQVCLIKKEQEMRYNYKHILARKEKAALGKDRVV